MDFTCVNCGKTLLTFAIDTDRYEISVKSGMVCLECFRG